MEYYMTDERIAEYLKALENEERAAATVEKYRRALLSFAAFLSGAAVTPEMIRLWKDDLREKNYAPSTINACLAALNGWPPGGGPGLTDSILPLLPWLSLLR